MKNKETNPDYLDVSLWPFKGKVVVILDKGGDELQWEGKGKRNKRREGEGKGGERRGGVGRERYGREGESKIGGRKEEGRKGM